MAFRERGHDAYSCDLLPCEGPLPQYHIQGDVLQVVASGDYGIFDLGIFHPPCKFIAYSGNAHWNAPGRVFKRLQALDFFAQCLYCPHIKRIAVENPKGCADAVIRKPDQVIHPYFFGERQMKQTYLWLHNLPPLQHWQDNLFFDTTHTARPEPLYKDKKGKNRYFTDGTTGKDGGDHKRSVTFASIATAMADQWGALG